MKHFEMRPRCLEVPEPARTLWQPPTKLPAPTFRAFLKVETMTTEQQWEWIRKRGVPDAETYLAELVEQIERFVGKS